MFLRWKLAVVLGGGGGLGHEVCLRLARAGAGVLVADADGATAESTALLARECRVSAWSLRVHPADDADLGLLAARCRDLGGADIVVTTGLDPDRAAVVAGMLLVEPRWLGVTVAGADGPRAAAVLAALRDADPGPVALCL